MARRSISNSRTNLEWFRIKADTLTYVERKPPARTSNPFTDPEPVIDADEILERIATVQEENLKRLDDDIDILKSYLKTQHAPKNCWSSVELSAVGMWGCDGRRPTGNQVPHRTTQRMFVIFAERNGIIFDERGYPSHSPSRQS